MFKAALALGLLTAVALAVVFASAGNGASPVSAGGGGMEAMSIDADPTGNTATTLGDRDECVEVAAGADVMVDVTALNIPAAQPMFGFAYEISYDPDNLSVTAVDYEQMLAALPDSTTPLTDAGDVIPDTDGTFTGGAIDLSATQASSESGSGVLSRLTFSVDGSAPAGGYPLLITGGAAHLNPSSQAFAPESVFGAQLAVGVTCESLGPVPTPGADFIFGDIDCDGDVDAVDGLQILRHVGGFGANQGPDCPDMGEIVADVPWGDIDCDGDVDAVDALQILRHVGGFGANQGAGCPPVAQ